MGPYDAASADRAINITLHRREIDLLEVPAYESAGQEDVLPRGRSVVDRRREPWGSENILYAPSEGKGTPNNGEIVVDTTRRTVQALAMSRVRPLTGWE